MQECVPNTPSCGRRKKYPTPKAYIIKAIHGLGHSFISILMDAGYNPKPIQVLSGHDVMAAAMSYAKAFDTLQNQMIEYISAFQRGGCKAAGKNVFKIGFLTIEKSSRGN